MKKENVIISFLVIIILILAFGIAMLYESNKRSEKFFADSQKLLADVVATCKQPAAIPVPVKAEKKLLRDDIYRIVFSHQVELNNFYSKQKDAKTNRMRIALEIQNTGTVTDVKVVESDIKNKNASECVTSVIKSIQFPTFDGESVTDEVYLTFDSRSLIK